MLGILRLLKIWDSAFGHAPAAYRLVTFVVTMQGIAIVLLRLSTNSLIREWNRAGTTYSYGTVLVCEYLWFPLLLASVIWAYHAVQSVRRKRDQTAFATHLAGIVFLAVMLIAALLIY